MHTETYLRYVHLSKDNPINTKYYKLLYNSQFFYNVPWEDSSMSVSNSYTEYNDTVQNCKGARVPQ